MNVITSLMNEKVKNWTKLNQKKYRDLTDTFLIEDLHLITEALKYDLVEEIISLNDEEYDVPCYKVTEEIMNKISSQMSGAKIIAVCKKKSLEKVGNKILILDNIQDPGNLGTIIRSAVAFNIETIVLSNDCVDLYNSKVIRSTEGMLFNINIIRKDLINFMSKLKEDGYKIYSTNVSGGTDVNDITLTSKVAIVMGSEGHGVRREINELCDDYIYIKMNKLCESLNVGVATSIILYEMNKKMEG